MPRSLFDQPGLPTQTPEQPTQEEENPESGSRPDATLRETAARLLPDVPTLEDFPHAETITTEEEVREAGGSVTPTEGRGKHAGKTYHRYRLEGPIVLDGRIQRSVHAGPVEEGSSFEWNEGGGLSDDGAIRRDMKRVEARIEEDKGETIRQADSMYLTYLDRAGHEPSKKARPRIWMTFHKIALFAEEDADPTVFLYNMAHHILDVFNIPDDSDSWPKAIGRRVKDQSLSTVGSEKAHEIGKR